MRYREFLKSRLEDNIPQNLLLPSGFHLVGHVALLHLNFDSMQYAKMIGDVTLEFDQRVKSVLVKTGPTQGKIRKPSYVLVAGDCNTITTHIERGVKFRLDPTSITFSGGNKTERIRLARLVKHKEHVVDMFSCVGQFALHIAKAADVKVTAIEINPVAFGFLTENIKLNRLDDRVTAILGNCSRVHPINSADRVIMGYLHDTISYLPAAVETLVDEGGMIHMHLALPKAETNLVVQEIDRVCTGFGFQPAIEVLQVKNYSPGIEHYVFDIHLKHTKA